MVLRPEVTFTPRQISTGAIGDAGREIYRLYRRKTFRAGAVSQPEQATTPGEGGGNAGSSESKGHF